MNATKTKATTKAIENYEHPKTRAGRSIRYFVDVRPTAPKPHVVVVEWAAGESDHPTVIRHATVEAARATWKDARNRMKTDGYSRES